MTMAMLRREDEMTAQSATAAAVAGVKPVGELNALLGKGSSFEGKLVFEGSVRIDGRFTGEIMSSDLLIIGEGAEVKGDVAVGTLVIVGEYNGNAKAAKSIEIKAPAKVRGTLTTASIMIERGVFFDGHCKMDPTGAGVSAPSTSSSSNKPFSGPTAVSSGAGTGSSQK
jgi:cytoskeletal protein CcmA (bactofilin family)